jgi:hypothetical protein
MKQFTVIFRPRHVPIFEQALFILDAALVWAFLIVPCLQFKNDAVLYLCSVGAGWLAAWWIGGAS